MTQQANALAVPVRGKRARPWYVQLWFQVLVAMVVVIALGHLYPTIGADMQPLGDAFIKAIRVLIAPIIFCTVVHGISSMANMAKVGRVALKALIYFEVLTTVALIIGLVAVNIFRPGVGMNIDLAHLDTSSVASYIEQTHKQTTAQFLLNIIPNTFFGEGYSFNLDGTCLYLATAAAFLAQATNTPLSIEQQIGLLLVLLLASKGAAGVAGAAFVVLAATLASVGSVPVESVALILGVHRLMSEGLTPTNLVGNAVATIVVAKWEKALDEQRLQQVLDGAHLTNGLARAA